MRRRTVSGQSPPLIGSRSPLTWEVSSPVASEDVELLERTGLTTHRFRKDWMPVSVPIRKGTTLADPWVPAEQLRRESLVGVEDGIRKRSPELTWGWASLRRVVWHWSGTIDDFLQPDRVKGSGWGVRGRERISGPTAQGGCPVATGQRKTLSGYSDEEPFPLGAVVPRERFSRGRSDAAFHLISWSESPSSFCQRLWRWNGPRTRLEDERGRGTEVCIDGRKNSPTRYRLFEQTRHPNRQGAVLIELGAVEEGIVVHEVCQWLESDEARVVHFRRL